MRGAERAKLGGVAGRRGIDGLVNCPVWGMCAHWCPRLYLPFHQAVSNVRRGTRSIALLTVAGGGARIPAALRGLGTRISARHMGGER